MVNDDCIWISVEHFLVQYKIPLNPASHSLSPRSSHVPLQQQQSQLQQQQADTLGQQLLQQQQQVVGAASNNNSGGEGAQSGRVGSKESSYITIIVSTVRSGLQAPGLISVVRTRAFALRAFRSFRSLWI